MNWKAGDVAIILPHNDGALMPGTEVFLIKYVGDIGGTTGNGEEVTARNAWMVDAGYCSEMGVSEAVLGRLPPPNELSTWEDCVFKPRELVT